MTTKPPALFSINDLSLRFGGLKVLSDIKLDVEAGEVVGLIGPNGAGKSALLNCISGIYRPQTGQVRLAGRPIDHSSPHAVSAAGIGRTFQHANLLASMTVLENVLIGLSSELRQGVLHRLFRPFASVRNEKQARAKAMRALERCTIAQYAGTSVGALSLGNRKKVDLARALVSEPKLLLLDEPAAGLSRDERSLIPQLVRSALAENPIGVIWIEHDLELVISAATRVAVLQQGRVVATGNPAGGEPERQRLINAYLHGSATQQSVTT
jgi:branched-chain amino acid transport system ATP-binding protein